MHQIKYFSFNMKSNEDTTLDIDLLNTLICLLQPNHKLRHIYNIDKNIGFNKMIISKKQAFTDIIECSVKS